MAEIILIQGAKLEDCSYATLSKEVSRLRVLYKDGNRSDKDIERITMIYDKMKYISDSMRRTTDSSIRLWKLSLICIGGLLLSFLLYFLQKEFI